PPAGAHRGHPARLGERARARRGRQARAAAVAQAGDPGQPLGARRQGPRVRARLGPPARGGQRGVLRGGGRAAGGDAMSAIDEVFFNCSHQGRAAFIPFIMAGDPDLESTGAYMEALAAGGADIIELGVPFSDPIADGPVNQRAAARALAAGTKLSAILQLVARHRDKLGIPIILFTYFNPIHARGVERFAEQAAASGVDGVLCVDLPPEEGERELVPALRQQGVDAIFLVAPTSTRERIDRVARASTGFVYYVSRTGVTGERTALATDLVKDVKRLSK